MGSREGPYLQFGVEAFRLGHQPVRLILEVGQPHVGRDLDGHVDLGQRCKEIGRGGVEVRVGNKTVLYSDIWLVVVVVARAKGVERFRSRSIKSPRLPSRGSPDRAEEEGV